MAGPQPHPDLQGPSEIEFVSSDFAATTNFLASTFGWETKVMAEWKMGTAKWGLKIAGMIRNEEAFPKGYTQTTILYMTVPDIHKEVKRLTKLGASVFKAVVDIPNMGSWGYMKVPGDLILGLWSNAPTYKPEEKVVTKKPGDATTLTFSELVTADAEAAAAFFNDAYHWGFNKSDFHGQEYWYSRGDHQSFSFGLRKPKSKSESSPDIVAYVNMETIAASLTKAKKNGAKAIGGKIDYAPHGNAQITLIPGDVRIGLWESDNDVQQGRAATKKAAAPAKKAAAPAKNDSERPTRRAASASAKKAIATQSQSTKKRALDAPKPNKRAAKKAKKE